MKPQYIYSPGKIMLTGEYLVLKGAESLAIPIKFGQKTILKIDDNKNQNIIIWESFDFIGYQWLNVKISFPEFEILESNNTKAANFVKKVLSQIHFLNPLYFEKGKQYSFENILEFNQKLGLGSSSSLMANLSYLCNVNAFDLLKNTIGGSGYDVAVAIEKKPIIYSIINSKASWSNTEVKFPFSDNIFFLHLGVKQSSESEVKKFNKSATVENKDILRVSQITYEMLYCKTFNEFCQLIEEHENIIGQILSQEPIKKRLFNDFNGSIKSLGAWGGDLVMVCSIENPKAYFKEKGFETLFAYGDIVR